MQGLLRREEQGSSPSTLQEVQVKHAKGLALGITLAVVLAGVALVAGTKVKVQEDKTFNFTGLRTYAWRLDGANPVKMLQSTDDNPAEIRKNLEPLILAAVDKELAQKGFTRVSLGESELYLDYYVLIGPGVTSQYQGQFVGAVPEWGLPGFTMNTTSLSIYEQGSLLIDVNSAKERRLVWRAAADAKVDRSRTPAQRASLISEAVSKMLKKFPPKFKK
jgi:hypothetical protein